MFDFFTIIFNKALSALASVVIALGLVSAPVPENPVSITEETQEMPASEIEASKEEKQEPPQIAQEEKKPKPAIAVVAPGIPKPIETEKPKEPEPNPEPKETKEETAESRNEKARNEAKQKFMQEWLENPARQTIDTFLSDPNILSFQRFCAKAKNTDGLTTKNVLNADRTAMIDTPIPLYEEQGLCKSLDDKSFNWVAYSDNFLLPLTNNEDSDETRKRKIEYNEIIKSLSKYKMFGFRDGGSRRNPDELANAVFAEIQQRSSVIQQGQSAGAWPSNLPKLSFLNSFLAPEKELRPVKLNFCNRTAKYTATYTEDYRVREENTSIGGGFCEEVTKIIPKIESPEEQSDPDKTASGDDFIKLRWTSPNGTVYKQFFNPEINKQEIDIMVDNGWEVVDSNLSRPISFGSPKKIDEKPFSQTPTPPPASEPAIVFSDYNFNYQWKRDDYGSTLTCPITPRQIVVKKAVFEIPASGLQKINELKSFEADGLRVVSDEPSSTISSTHGRSSSTYSLEKRDANTYVYFGGEILICTDGASVRAGGLNVYITDISGLGRNVRIYLEQKGVSMALKNDSQFYIPISPIMSEWEIWDNTTNKPVKIQ